jgi:hypothetical protein
MDSGVERRVVVFDASVAGWLGVLDAGVELILWLDGCVEPRQ